MLTEQKIYSQKLEEVYILRACAQLGRYPESGGRYLDVGAWNAFSMSNTRALFDLGWSGVMVEPSPLPFASLTKEYGSVPRVELINAAVVLDDIAEVEMHVSEDAISTTEEANYEKWKDVARFDAKITVPAITLERIFEKYGDFDFVNIDTEGTSTDLLHRMLSLGARPKAICVEHDGRTTEILAAVTELGYACTYANGENLVLVR